MKEEDVKKIIHSYPRNVYGQLSTSAQGLSEEEVKKRLSQYGKNEITKEKKTPLWKIFVSNFISPMAILLWVAGILSLITSFIGTKEDVVLQDPQMLYLAVAIWLVNIINGIFSFMQQFKAGKMTDALAKMLPQYARVIRDGEEKRISATELVPGDIMILAEGDRISADARILMCDDLSCTQAALDGEATPARKTHEPLKEEPDSLVGAKNLVFAGTSVSTGSARCVVIATGMETEFGKIASLTQNIQAKKSPLQKEIERATKVISMIACSVGALVFLLGIIVNGIQKESFSKPNLYLEQFVFALGMIVAFIPEGLSPTVTLSLAKAVQRIAKDGALIKSLTSVETLGSATVICSDKTGTLTKNEMTVKSLYLSTGVLTVTGNGYSPEGHIACRSLEADISVLRQKQDNGADYIMTQLCWDMEQFKRWLDAIRKAGVTMPVDVGIMPILDQAATINMALSRNGCVMDRELSRMISRHWLFPNPFNPKDADGKPFDMFYDKKVKEFKEEGIEYTIRQIDEYRALGVNGIHLYALNKWKDVSEIIERSGLRTLV